MIPVRFRSRPYSRDERRCRLRLYRSRSVYAPRWPTQASHLSTGIVFPAMTAESVYGVVELFERQRRDAPRLANDTSLGVGFAPLTPLEEAVLASERSLQDRASPERGEDVKVMGVRRDERTALTVACAFVGRHLTDLDAYLAARDRAAAVARAAAASALGREPALEVNTADDPAAESVYLTVTGTSAEAGDDGQ